MKKTILILLVLLCNYVTYSQSIEDKKRYSNYSYEDGRRAMQDKDYKWAIRNYTHAIETYPYWYYYNARAEAKSNLGDYKGAVADLTKAIELGPDIGINYNSYFERAEAKYNLEDYRGAIADMNKVIETTKKYPYHRRYYVRGNAKYKLGDKEGACWDWSKAGELGSSESYDQIKQYCK